MIIQVTGAVLLGAIFVIVLMDIIPIFKTWLTRIHIGRYDDKDIWNKSITNTGVKWLNKTPKVRVTDNTRLVIIDMLKGNYTRNNIQHWQEASLILGLVEYLKLNDNKQTKHEIMHYINKKFDDTGQWIKKPKQVDGAILAYAIMKLNFIDSNKYKKAYDYIWELIEEHKGEDGTVGYRKSMKSYRYVDTIGFICPFLVSYGIRYNKKECIDLAVKQIKEYERNGMLKNRFIPGHAYKVENNLPLGLYGWGRGLGWFAIGLMDSWNELPQNNRYKPVLNESIKRYAKEIMQLQQQNGSWNWTVTRSESRADSSTTATLAWFLVNAARIEDIEKNCLQSKNKAINYLMTVTRRNGVVDFSQGDTKDIGVYSMMFNIMPFTQGLCMRTAYSHKSYGGIIIDENNKRTS